MPACRLCCPQEAAGRTPQRSFFGRMLAAVGGGPADPRAVLASLEAEVAALERLRQALHAGGAGLGWDGGSGLGSDTRRAGQACAAHAPESCQPHARAPAAGGHAPVKMSGRLSMRVLVLTPRQMCWTSSGSTSGPCWRARWWATCRTCWATSSPCTASTGKQAGGGWGVGGWGGRALAAGVVDASRGPAVAGRRPILLPFHCR